MNIETIEIAGMASVLKALRLPFGKDCRSSCDSFFSEDKAEKTTVMSYGSDCLINDKDIKLLSTLVKRGDAHAKVLRGLIVYMEIEAPVYWWCEMETHRSGHERLSSSSTMHIDAKGLKDEELVKFKSEMPMGKILKKIDLFSYQALRNIYKLRHDHRLPEWHTFCHHIEQLPLFNELIMPDNEQKDN
jgi:hypothetical protein